MLLELCAKSAQLTKVLIRVTSVVDYKVFFIKYAVLLTLNLFSLFQRGLLTAKI